MRTALFPLVRGQWHHDSACWGKHLKNFKQRTCPDLFLPLRKQGCTDHRQENLGYTNICVNKSLQPSSHTHTKEGFENTDFCEAMLLLRPHMADIDCSFCLVRLRLVVLHCHWLRTNLSFLVIVVIAGGKSWLVGCQETT